MEVLAMMDFVKGKDGALHRQAREVNGLLGLRTPPRRAGAEQVEEAEALHFPGGDKFLLQVVHKGHCGGGGVGNAVGGHDLDHIFFGPVLEKGKRRRGRAGAVGGGGAGLPSCVHVGLVVVADEDKVLVALRRTRERLKADIKGAAVPGEDDHGGLAVSLEAKPSFHPAAHGGGAGKGTVQDGAFQAGQGRQPGDDAPAGGGDHKGGFLPQGAGEIAHQEGRPAAGAGRMARVEQAAVNSFFR